MDELEGCKLNNIDSQDYLKHLFECILHGKDCDKKALLSYFYKPKCKNKNIFLLTFLFYWLKNIIVVDKIRMFMLNLGMKYLDLGRIIFI